ncbi:MAG: ion transporter [Chloroflexi bacterium AL-W]|nr:ion transporter [Chloroflexi bacterium AL-N1]NOK67471.1 ion transporter [Chloroflexi bacterium AL-N10]NOK75037.1 ion transporter [Chloroflexi bacterium AL-N5]NOK81824.1 ion transporter [Chloroflexi bacterium AL-W]NOK89670.1 ion transporter [Chloroflexi bacterium AL-N15]
MKDNGTLAPWQQQLHSIIFEADTPAGRFFDVMLIICIFTSVLVVILESVVSIQAQYGLLLIVIEWIFTILFTIEYVLRLLSVRRPLRYAFSFFGIIDLLSIIPTYLAIFVAGVQSLIVIRVFRLLRLFRILKMVKYINEANVLLTALRASQPKITVFLLTVLSVTVIVGAAMHLIEGPEHGFTNIPMSMYWAIVTLTTVGFGDITPQTTPGRLLASILMVMGYGIIAVPTGIVSVELSRATRAYHEANACHGCGRMGHDLDAEYCKYCGEALEQDDSC